MLSDGVSPVWPAALPLRINVWRTILHGHGPVRHTFHSEASPPPAVGQDIIIKIERGQGNLIFGSPVCRTGPLAMTESSHKQSSHGRARRVSLQGCSGRAPPPEGVPGYNQSGTLPIGVLRTRGLGRRAIGVVLLRPESRRVDGLSRLGGSLPVVFFQALVCFTSTRWKRSSRIVSFIDFRTPK